uniref:Uncharacterized protein n=1 Tax=Panagrolaimus superbus TaxID=310955 RepID=A0A914Z4S7_9BILA
MTSSSASESSLKSSTLPSFDSTPSVSLSPIKNENVQKIDNADQMNSPKTNNYNNSNKFLSSLTSNGGWGEIESAINGTIADTESSENKANFGKSFHLFGNSFNQSQNNY